MTYYEAQMIYCTFCDENTVELIKDGRPSKTVLYKVFLGNKLNKSRKNVCQKFNVAVRDGIIK